MTVIGFTIGKPAIVDNIILEYNGKIDNTTTTKHLETIENCIENIDIKKQVYNCYYQLVQNITMYAKSSDEINTEIVPNGFIKIKRYSKEKYSVRSQNIVNIDDVKIIRTILENKEEIVESLETGFSKLINLSSNIDFNFRTINDDKCYFYIKVTIGS
jgi:hypothetical protein